MKSIVAMLGKDYLLEMEEDPMDGETDIRVRSVLTKEVVSKKIGAYEAINDPHILEKTVTELMAQHKELYGEAKR